MVAYFHNPHWGGRDRWIPGPHSRVSLAHLASSGPSETTSKEEKGSEKLEE